MIAEINKQGMLTISTETESEKIRLQHWVEKNAVDVDAFTDCCGKKKCAFKLELNDNG